MTDGVDTRRIWDLSLAEELLLFAHRPADGLPVDPDDRRVASPYVRAFERHGDDAPQTRHLVATAALVELATVGAAVVPAPGAVRLAQPDPAQRTAAGTPVGWRAAVLAQVAGTHQLKALFGLRDRIHDSVGVALGQRGLTTALEPGGFSRMRGVGVRFEVHPNAAIEQAWGVYRAILLGQAPASPRAALLLQLVIQHVGATWLFARDPRTLDEPNWWMRPYPTAKPDWWEVWPTDAVPTLLEGAAFHRPR